MRRPVLIPAAALALLAVSAAGHAQADGQNDNLGDATIDATSVGAAPSSDAEDQAIGSTPDRDERTAALDDSIAAEEERMRDAAQPGDEGTSDGAPPKARDGDYGADDFRAPSDDELSAASDKARAAEAAAADEPEDGANDTSGDTEHSDDADADADHTQAITADDRAADRDAADRDTQSQRPTAERIGE